jgi:Sec-independent protein translocase protein TatA
VGPRAGVDTVIIIIIIIIIIIGKTALCELWRSLEDSAKFDLVFTSSDLAAML